MKYLAVALCSGGLMAALIWGYALYQGYKAWEDS